MARLKINANDVSGVSVLEIRYRKLGSSDSYTIVEVAPEDLPYITSDTLDPGQYEVGIRKKCGTVWSSWAVGQSGACAVPLKFTATRVGDDFAIIYGLAAGQTNFEVEVTDPNNGKSIIPFTGASEGDELIPISPVIEGTYTLRLRGICSITPTPDWSSEWSAPVSVNVVSSCSAPVLSSGPTIQAQNDTTITNRVIITGYTSNIRVRIRDNNSGIDVSNAIQSGSGTVDITVFKGGNYTAYISNICFGGEEQTISVPLHSGSISLSVKYSMILPSLCGTAPGTVYISSAYSNIQTGVVVYSDAAMTTLLSGYDYITNVQGDIFNFNAIDAIVEAATGSSCS